MPESMKRTHTPLVKSENRAIREGRVHLKQRFTRQ